MKALAGRKALVTGGTRGIGRAIATRLAAEGAQVTVTGRTGAGKPPARCRFAAVDFADPSAVLAFAERVRKERFGILVNNAGINAVSPAEDISDADFEAVHRVNVVAPMALSRAALPGMRHAGWGRIVNVSSVYGVVSKAGRASYSASKFALDGLTAAFAAEAAADGVLINTVCPGFIDTDLTRQVLGPKGMEAAAKAVPIGRLGKPEEIAVFVTWLCSPENTYISGQRLIIDGGFCRV